LETAVATLLLVTASVVLACVVVTLAVTTIEQTINTQNIPQMAQLKTFENRLLNETNVMTGALQQAPSPTP
jgi:predicted PurR-regulated permease PerM